VSLPCQQCNQPVPSCVLPSSARSPARTAIPGPAVAVQVPAPGPISGPIVQAPLDGLPILLFSDKRVVTIPDRLDTADCAPVSIDTRAATAMSDPEGGVRVLASFNACVRRFREEFKASCVHVSSNVGFATASALHCAVSGITHAQKCAGGTDCICTAKDDESGDAVCSSSDISLIPLVTTQPVNLASLVTLIPTQQHHATHHTTNPAAWKAMHHCPSRTIK
jgi:hypothetical protein